jgi:hypothetical protein
VPVTETHQGIGGWNLRVRPGAEGNEVTQLINQWDHVYIVPTGVGSNPTFGSLRETAIFAGRVDQLQAGRDGVEIGGPSIAVWLGDEQGNGPVAESTATFNDPLNTIIGSAAFTTILGWGGLTLGTRQNMPTGNISWVRGAYKTIRAYYQELQDLVSIPFEWIVRPNGNVDIEGWTTTDYTATLFDFYPNLMISDALVRSAAMSNYGFLERALQVFPGDISVNWDFSRWAARCYAFGNNNPPTIRNNNQKVNFGLVGNNPALNTVQWDTIIDGQTDVTSQLDVLAAQTNRYASIRREWTVEASSAEVRFFVKPGDFVWLHATNLPGIGSMTYAQEQSEWAGVNAATDPATARFADAANVSVGGRPVYPVRARVSSIDWPVCDSLFDVYLVNTWDGTGNVTLLNPYLDWDADTGVSMDCNANRPMWQLLVPTAETYSGRVRQTFANRRRARLT